MESEQPSQLLRLMGRYARLHDNRVHNDHEEKNPALGLRNRASCDRAEVSEEAKAEAEAEEAKYRHVGGGGGSGRLGGGGSGRLGAAVQRAMAMRERQSTEADEVKGIGAMRHLCNIHNTLSAPPSAEINAEEDARQTLNIVSPPPGIRNQSMRYSRFFCPAPNAEEYQCSSLNKPPGLGIHITSPSLPQSHQIAEACNSLPLPQRSANAPPKKKGFLRKLFRLHKKTTSISTSYFR